MNTRKHIEEELNDLNSSLPADSNAFTYSVPDGYFDSLASAVLAKIKGEHTITASEEISELSPLLAGLSRAMPYSLPDNYFQDLSAITDEKEESAVLSYIGKTMPYDVPPGYFDTLPGALLERLHPSRAKVIPMYRKKWMKMAVAASIAGIIAISGFFYFNKKDSISVNNPQWVAKNIKNVSSTAIEEFIKTTDVTLTSTNTTTAQTKPKTADVKKLLQDVPDKELETFLDQVPTDDDDLVINGL
jgi:hypothetical protein